MNRKETGFYSRMCIYGK